MANQNGPDYENQVMVTVMVINLYSAFSINIFKCALQAKESMGEIELYRRRRQPLLVH